MDSLNSPFLRRCKLTFLIVGTSLLTACATPALDTSSVDLDGQVNQIKKNEASLADQILQAQQELVELGNLPSLRYAPLHWQQANDQCDLAALSYEDYPDNATKALALCKELTQKIPNVIERVRAELVETEEQIAHLVSLKANEYHEDDMSDLRSDFKELIRFVESDPIRSAELKQVFKDEMIEVEIQTLKSIYLQPVARKIDEAEDVDAEYFASKTFATAETKYQQAEAQFAVSYRNRALIEQVCLDALRAAEHAINVASSVKSILQIDPKQAEQHVHEVEALLHNIGQALGHKDVRHMKLQDQSNAIAQSADILSKRLENQLKNNQWEAERQKLLKEIASLKNRVESN